MSSDLQGVMKPEKKQASQSENDKTRIAPQAEKKTVQSLDKTRIAPAARKRKTNLIKNRIISETAKNTINETENTRLYPTTISEPSNTQKDTTDSDATRKDTTWQDKDKPESTETLKDKYQSSARKVLKGRFILEKVLGVGGMGIVFKAKDRLKVEANDREPYVAIKVLSEDFKTHPEALIMLQRESRKSQRIAHPNIVNVFDFDRDGETVFMTMEFLDGNPLDQLINQYKSTGLPSDDGWDIIRDMSSALIYAHSERIIHSDLKPGNVFVTQKGVTKVLDFGIARAVAQVELLDENTEDETIFDAGNLGALTPAYASLEMLKGKEPHIRDDIFALGCVAYEILTGRHPYKKVPADEAEQQGLKPERITHIKKYQWRAIEKAIALRRENRIESVEKFVEAISPSIRSYNQFLMALLLLISSSIVSYLVFFEKKFIVPEYSEIDIRNELELKIRIGFYKERLDGLIKWATFTDPWQDTVWKDVSDLSLLAKDESVWLEGKKTNIYQLYLEQIKIAISEKMYAKARGLIDNARRYSLDVSALKIQTEEIAAALQSDQGRQAELALQARVREQKILAQQRQQSINKKQKSQQLATLKKQTRLFDIALDNVHKQLKCQGRINMRDFETAANKLKQLDPVRFNRLQSNIINSLASCIIQLAKAFPNRAMQARIHSLRIFESNAILENLSIEQRDPCDQSLAGLGARGKRTICRDEIKGLGKGPELVVIPGSSKIQSFAIGKFEVSIDEMNKFCKNSEVCDPQKGIDHKLPVSKIKIDAAMAYLKWLTKQTKQKYRLPTKIEWLYAAKSRRKNLDANRNCKLRTRGILKGGELIKVNIGQQNSWGLVNYVGNVQELVFDKGHKLLAVGGSYQQPMKNCDITTVKSHAGQADRATGIRVLREVKW